MVKTLDGAGATYEPSRRSLNWLRLKKDYLDGEGAADSLDLVPIGAFHGKGKRTGTFGAYLLACYAPDAEEFQTVCKIGTGFSDEQLAAFTAAAQPHIVGSGRKPREYRVGDSLTPDVWLDAKLVWEVRAADLSLSPVHTGAIGRVSGARERGIALRFPRFLRVRDDKPPTTATNAEQVLDMYQRQDVIARNAKDDDDDDDDGFI